MNQQVWTPTTLTPTARIMTGIIQVDDGDPQFGVIWVGNGIAYVHEKFMKLIGKKIPEISDVVDMGLFSVNVVSWLPQDRMFGIVKTGEQVWMLN